MGKTLDGLIFRWFTEDVDSIKRRLDALEAQGERAMAKVVDLIAAVQAGTDATLAAIGQETSELAAIIGAQTAALVALQEQIAAGDFVTAEQIAEVTAQSADVVSRIQAISDAVAPAPAP